MVVSISEVVKKKENRITELRCHGDHGEAGAYLTVSSMPLFLPLSASGGGLVRTGVGSRDRPADRKQGTSHGQRTYWRWLSLLLLD